MQSFLLVDNTIAGTSNYILLVSLFMLPSTVGQSIRIQITACSQYSATAGFDETYDIVFHTA